MFRVLVIFSVLAISSCVFAQTGDGKPAALDYGVRKISINSVQNDYSPVLMNGNLLFTSENRTRVGAYFSSADSNSVLASLYLSRQVNDTIFEEPELLNDKINRFYNCGPASAEISGTRIYFTSNEPSSFLFSTPKTKSKLRIYTVYSTGGNWSGKEMLQFTEDANYTHPFINKSGDTLYFSSDLPGGFGGFDLYYSVLRDSQWSVPVNLGPIVNSESNELFPALGNGNLVYSSDRENGYGKLDLYEFNFSGKTITHFEKPFNSENDDFGYFAVTERKGYFTSNRDGNDDIYFYWEQFPDFQNCTPYVPDNFCYTFFEDVEELEESSNLEYTWSLGDGTIMKGKEVRHCFEGYGEYLVELNIVDKSSDSVFSSEASYPFEILPSERLHINGPDTVPPFVTVTWNAFNSSLPGLEIMDYYWDVDQGTLRNSKCDSISINFNTPGTHMLIMGVRAADENGTVFEKCVSKAVTVIDGYSLILPQKTNKFISVDHLHESNPEPDSLKTDESNHSKADGEEPENFQFQLISRDHIVATLELSNSGDSSELSVKNCKKLTQFARNHHLDENQRILISSFTGNKENEEYNLKSARSLSAAIKTELIKNGYTSDRIDTVDDEYLSEYIRSFSDDERHKSIIIIYEKN